jgi:hypothetical protein
VLFELVLLFPFREPSVLQLIYIIRRGKAEDSLQALEALIRTSLSKPETRKDIVSCGGLHTLTSIMSSSTYSGAMEIYTPLAVMLLVPMVRVVSLVG